MLRSWTRLETIIIEGLRASPILRFALLFYTFLSLLLSAPALAFG